MSVKISVSELKENMRFSAPVFFDDESFMLVDKGVPIKKRELDALARWNIPFVITSGRVLKESETLEELEKPKEAANLGKAAQEEPKKSNAYRPEPAELPDLAEFNTFKEFNWEEASGKASNKALGSGFADAKMPLGGKNSEQDFGKPKTVAGILPEDAIERLVAPPKNVAHYAAYKGLVNELDKAFSGIRDSASAAPRALDSIVGNLKRFVKECHADSVSFIVESDIPDKEMAKNAIHTAILSMIIAESIPSAAAGIELLATGALLHNIGMLRVPDAITGKAGKLSDSEISVMRSHSEWGRKIIVDQLLYPEEVALPASQHHECWDGSGYPAGLSGTEISIQARIVSAADAFEAMVSPRPHRARLSGYEAMKNLIADNARRFDPDIIKAMVQNIGIYPCGSLVLMNNSSIARVLQVFPGMPVRPVVNILISESGEVLAKDETLDLRSNKELFIVRAISPSELSYSSASNNTP